MDRIDDRIRQYIADLASANHDAVLHAEAMLIGIGVPAVNALMDATRSEAPQSRWRAAYALSRIGDRRAYPAILDLVVNHDGPMSETRYNAMLALGELGDPRAIGPLSQIMLTSEPGESAVQWASVALGVIGESAIEALIGVLDAGHFFARIYALDILQEIAQRGSETSSQAIGHNLRRYLRDPEIGDEVASLLGSMERTLDTCERIVARLFERCGFSYDAGMPPGPDGIYAEEVVSTPYEEFSRKVVPGDWLRSVALHLHDTHGACDQVIAILRRIPRCLDRGGPDAADLMQDLSVELNLYIGEELRSHVFWALTLSDTIRDTILSNNEIESLAPARARRRFRARLSVKDLAEGLSRPGRLTEAQAPEVARQLVSLELQCRRTRGVIEELVSEPDAPSMDLFQRFTNVQGAMLDTAQLLLRADLVPKCLWFDRSQWTEIGRWILGK